ncbi:MAG TPA: lysophospholipid acyltransferase family protein [Polyangiaceae bacterium]|nr:lysophospholipid acyltransferase family protein [Polyangiaceae bacterium]
MAYRALTWLLRIIAGAFFRQVEVVGLENVPTDGPVLFAGNHPNSLLDPVLIITTCGRRVSFAAKDTLWKSRLLRFVLDGLGAVPIARRDDHPGSKPLDNDAAFSAMYGVLAKSGSIGIFPEGLSHDASQLSTLKTGAARLALGAHGKVGGPVKIVPCGLTFIHPARFRSLVLVQYGAPIVVDDDWAARHAADPKTAARELTLEIEKGLRGLTVNAPDWETVRALDAVRRLYQPLDIAIEDRVELARRFNAHYGAVKDEPRVAELMDRVRDYQEDLDDLGLTDRELARGLAKRDIVQKTLRYLGLFLIWMPLSIPGLPLHVPAILLARLSGKYLTPRKDVVATTKVLAGVLSVMLAYGVVSAIALGLFGWQVALATAVMLPISGYAALRVFDRLKLLRRGVGALLRHLRYSGEIETLRARRSSLSDDIARVVSQMKPAGLVPLFPRPQRDEPERA